MMGSLCAFGGISSSSGSSAIDGKGRMMFLIKLTAKIGKTILLKSLWLRKQRLQIHYQISIQTYINYFIIQICDRRGLWSFQNCFEATINHIFRLIFLEDFSKFSINKSLIDSCQRADNSTKLKHEKIEDIR